MAGIVTNPCGTAVVEFHGFKDNSNRFVVKELAVVGKHFQAHLVFKSPYEESLLNSKMLRTARWLTRHFHFMKWDTQQGIPYDEELIRALCSPFSALYTKGGEKVKFLSEFHFNVHEIKEPCTQSFVPKVTCLLAQHNEYRGKCALRSAKVLYETNFGSPNADPPNHNHV